MTKSVMPRQLDEDRQLDEFKSVKEVLGRMEPILDFFAQTVGWLNDDVVLSTEGYPIAFLRDGAVFSARNGDCFGQFAEGVFRDLQGCVVAYLHAAWWSIVHAAQQDAPPPPSVQSHLVPGRDMHPAAEPHLAQPLLQLSSLDWEGFVTANKPLNPLKTRR